MARTPFARWAYYYGTENSNSEWLRRFIIKHNRDPANRVPNWELPRLRLIVKILSEIENFNSNELKENLQRFSEKQFSNHKTTSEEVEIEMIRMREFDSLPIEIDLEITPFDEEDMPTEEDIEELDIDFGQNLIGGTNLFPEINNNLQIELDSMFGNEIEEYFEWPSTDAEPSWYGLTNLDSSEWPKIGVLKRMGYSVGARESLTERKRSEILDYIFQSSRLPFVHSYEHMVEWGPAKSTARLKKMANSIASFGRNMRRQNYYQALIKYDLDLDYLKKTYYDPFFDGDWFWPNSDETW